jgi:hypothetical protein
MSDEFSGVFSVLVRRRWSAIHRAVSLSSSSSDFSLDDVGNSIFIRHDIYGGTSRCIAIGSDKPYIADSCKNAEPLA